MNKTSVTMYVSLAANMVNVVGNAVGVFVLQAGILGVAARALYCLRFALAFGCVGRSCRH